MQHRELDQLGRELALEEAAFRGESVDEDQESATERQPSTSDLILGGAALGLILLIVVGAVAAATALVCRLYKGEDDT